MLIGGTDRRYPKVLFVGRCPNKLEYLPARDPDTLVVLSDRRLASLGHFMEAGEVLVALEASLFPDSAGTADRNVHLIDTLGGAGRTRFLFNPRSLGAGAIKAAIQANPTILYCPEERRLVEPEAEARSASFEAPLSDLSFLQMIAQSFAAPGATLHFCNFDEEFRAMEAHSAQTLSQGFIGLAEAGLSLSLHNCNYNLQNRILALLNAPSPESFETRVSLVIPLYNNERHIEETLQSVVDQNYESLEVIVIDDGSSDRSPELAKGFADRFTKFTYRRQENQGVSAARNHGLAIASGQYIAFLDADDLLLAESIRRRVAFLDSEGFRVCGGRTQIIDNDGRSLNLTIGQFKHCGYESNWQMSFQISTLMGQSAVMKRQAFRVDQRFAEDWRYLVDLTAVGERIGSCEGEPLSCYRWHPASATRTEFFNHFRGCIELMSELLLNDRGDAARNEKLGAGVSAIDAGRVGAAVVSRLQALYLQCAVCEGTDPLEPKMVDFMNSVKDHFPQTIPSARFESIVMRAFLLPCFSDALHEKVSSMALGVLQKLRALENTPANSAFAASLRRYLLEINAKLEKKGYKIKDKQALREFMKRNPL